MRRTLAIVAVVVAMLAAVGVAGGLLLVNANAKTTAWVATQDLAAGTTLDSSNTHQIQVASGTDSYTVLSTSPAGKQLAHAVAAHDVLRPDDLELSTMVQVPVSFKLAPGLVANDVVDIYAVGGASTSAAVSAANGTRLIARRITVVAVGSPSVISVPASQEPLWVTLSSSAVTLIATRSDGVNVPTTAHSYRPDEALDILSQLAAGNSTPSSAGGSTAAPPRTPSGGS